MDNISNFQTSSPPSESPNKNHSNRLPWIILAIVSIVAVAAIIACIVLAIQLNNRASANTTPVDNATTSSNLTTSAEPTTSSEPDTTTPSDEPTQSTGTIEEILNIDLDDINHVKVGGALEQDEDYPKDEFIETYGNLTYQRVNKSTGNTSHTYYVCYDDYGKILFTLVDVGNQNLVFLERGTFNINDSYVMLYQAQ